MFIYLFFVEYEFIFSVKKLMVSFIEKVFYIFYFLVFYEKLEYEYILFFESVEIESKVYIKFLLMVKVCLKFICNYNIVIIISLMFNGGVFL